MFSEVLSEISLFVLPLVKNSYKRLFPRQIKTLHFVKNIGRLQGVCTEILCYRYGTKILYKAWETFYIVKIFALAQEIIHEILSKISPFSSSRKKQLKKILYQKENITFDNIVTLVQGFFPEICRKSLFFF